MKTKIITILFLMASVMAFAEQIDWYESYDKALDAAKEQDKNIFVLITAPSWCIWCSRLEDNVLSKTEFQEEMRENYIPLMLLDEVDGKRNPELARFEFDGYPTVRLYDKNGGFIEDVYTQDPGDMVDSLIAYREAEGIMIPLIKDLKLPEKYLVKGEEGGVYINNFDEGMDKTWTLISNGEEKTYLQLKYDYEYLYLGLEGGEHYIALPMNGTDRHIAHYVEDKWVWSDLSDVERVGGDEYFDKL